MKNYKKELQALTFITQNQIFSLLAQNKQNQLRKVSRLYAKIKNDNLYSTRK